MNDEKVTATVIDEPPWTAVDESEGHIGLGNKSARLASLANATAVLHLIPAGHYFPLHTSHEMHTMVLVIRGRGVLTLPEGRRIEFTGPEWFLFQAGALHGWEDITEETLLCICRIEI